MEIEEDEDNNDVVTVTLVRRGMITLTTVGTKLLQVSILNILCQQ